MAENPYNLGEKYTSNIVGCLILALIAIAIGLMSKFRHSNEWPEPVTVMTVTNSVVGMDNVGINSERRFQVTGGVDTLKVYTMQRVEMRTQEGKFLRGSFLDNNVSIYQVSDGKDVSIRSLNIKAQRLLDRGYYFISEDHLRKVCLGRTFDEIDKMYRIAEYCIPADDGGADAYYPFLAMLTKDGYFFNTHMHFDTDGRCTTVERCKKLDRRNKGFLGTLPFTQTIMSWDWFTWLIQESPCGNYQPDGIWLLKFLSMLFFMFVFVAWFMLPPMTLWALFYAFAPLDKMRWASDTMLCGIGIALTGVGCYIWFIGLLAWGMHWIFCFMFIFDIAAVSIMNSSELPNDVRCPQCRSVGTMSMISTRLVRKKYLILPEYVSRGYDHSEERTETTTRSRREPVSLKVDMGNGHTSIINKEHCYIDTVEITYEDIYYRYDVYNVKYEIPIMRGKVRCSSCGYTNEREEYEGKRKIVSRDAAGQIVRKQRTIRTDEVVVDTYYQGLF